MVWKSKKKELLLIFLLVSILSIHKFYLLIRSPYCLGWDCYWYLNSLKNVPLGEILKETSEPLFFILMKPLSSFFNPVILLKIFNLVSPFIISFGFYFFMREKYSLKETFLSIFFINMAFGFTMLWFENFKNIMVIMFFPLFLWFLRKERFFLSGLVLSAMVWTHITAMIFLPFLIVYMMLKGDKRIFTVLLIGSLSFFILWLVSPQTQLGFIHILDVSLNEGSILIVSNKFLQNLYINSPFIFVSFLILPIIKKKHILELSLLISTFYLMISFLNVFNRVGYMIFIPIALTMPIFSKIVFKEFNIKLQVALILLLLIGWGVINYQYFTTYYDRNDEHSALLAWEYVIENIREPIVAVTEKDSFMLRFLGKENVINVGWYELMGEDWGLDTPIRDDNVVFFRGNESEVRVFVENMEQKPAYILYNYKDAFFDEKTVLSMKEKENGIYQIEKTWDDVVLAKITI